MTQTEQQIIEDFRKRFKWRFPNLWHIPHKSVGELPMRPQEVEAFILSVYHQGVEAGKRQALPAKPKYWDSWSVERQIGYNYARQFVGQKIEESKQSTKSEKPCPCNCHPSVSNPHPKLDDPNRAMECEHCKPAEGKKCDHRYHGNKRPFFPDTPCDYCGKTEECPCHCHSETEEMRRKGLRCKCIKNCKHCHPENFI